MAVRLDEQELSNLDKQTLIKMYLGLQDSVEKLSQSILPSGGGFDRLRFFGFLDSSRKERFVYEI